MPEDGHKFLGSDIIILVKTSIFVGGSVVHPFREKIPIGEITNVSFV